jgi:hypothetical protein
MRQDEPYTAVEILTFIFGCSSLAGLTRLLKSNKALTPRIVVAATLSTGLYSLGMAFALWTYFEEQRAVLTGLAILSGIGTQTSAEFIWSIVRNVIMSYDKTGGGK